MRFVFVWLSSLLLLCAPLTAAPSAAVIELHNLTDYALPRVGEYTEKTITRYFTRRGVLDFADRTAVMARLLDRGDRVVLFPSDPALAADFARDLGVDYLLTGNILDYREHGGHHRMTVELMVIGAEEDRRIFRKIYDADFHDSSGYKRHREMLDHIIDTMSAELENVVTDAYTEQERLAQIRAEEEAARIAAEKAAEEAARVAAEETARIAAEEAARLTAEETATRIAEEVAGRIAEEVAGRVAEEIAARVLEEEKARLEENTETDTELPEIDRWQKAYRVVPEPEEAALVTVQFTEVELLEDNWGDTLGDDEAEFYLRVMVPMRSGNADAYGFPYEGTISLDTGEPLPIRDGGFTITLAPRDGKVSLLFTGVDQDEPTGGFGLLLNRVIDSLASSASAIASMKGMRTGNAFLLGLGAGFGGDLIKSLVAENDVIGEGSLTLDGSGGGFADGKIHEVLSENGAMRLRFRVHITPKMFGIG